MRNYRLYIAIIITGVLAQFVGCARNCTGTQKPHQKVAELSKEPDAIYFIGDSITAGFGFRPNNDPLQDSWRELRTCNMPDPSGDACSNNFPGPFGPQKYTSAVAYPFQVRDLLHDAQKLLAKPLTPVGNFAVSGSTPANWDPVVVGHDASTSPAVFENSLWNPELLPMGGNAMFVLTLGANPLLPRWTEIRFLTPVIWAKEGPNIHCVDTLKHAMECMNKDIEEFKLREHLHNIYKYLLSKGTVLVQKYYMVCPWSFASNDPEINILGPSRGKACRPHLREIAFALQNRVNEIIDEVIEHPDIQMAAKQTGHHITSICPGGEKTKDQCSLFNNHQFTDPDPWIISIDTGLHPNATGHAHLARGVFRALCEQFGFYCAEQER